MVGGEAKLSHNNFNFNTMATDLQYREGLTDTQKNQLVTRLDRINAGSAITDTDKANFLS